MLWLLLDGPLLWIFAVVVLFALFGATHARSGGWCSTILVGAFLCIEFFSNLQPLHYLSANPLDALLLIGGYAFAGVIWCIVKWLSYTSMLTSDYNDAKAKYKMQNPNATDYDARKYAMGEIRITIPTADATQADHLKFLAKHKGDIYTWITFWPLSIVETVLNDPLTRFLRFTYNRLTNLMTDISKRAFGKVT